MKPSYEREIAANLERAEMSLRAAKEMVLCGFYDFAASRAYYVGFYAATAALLNEDLEFSKHSGVVAAVHQQLVKTGKLDKELGKELNWLFELRNVGDYGVIIHVSQQDAKKAIEVAENFLRAINFLLGKF